MVSAVLTIHRCPSCQTEVAVFAKEATVYHACPKHHGRHPMRVFEVVSESQRTSRTPPARDNGTAR